MSNNNICPVCGYEGLSQSAYDEHNCPTYEICPCCLNEFGYTNAKRTHEELREEWISNGKRWGGQKYGESPPHDWDAKRQLKNVTSK